MKKFLITAFTLLISLGVMAQTKKERAIQLYYGGEVLYSRAISMLDSLNFKWKDIPNSEEDEDEDDNDNILIEGNDSIYIGVVAFNGNIDEYKITNNLEGVKSFINARQNDNDKTAFAYAVSKGSEMFGAKYLPKFDKIFMLNFSDGTDNESNAKWGDAGRRVPSLFVYDTARYDISKIELLNSYALGFGASEANFRDKMKKVVLGSGDYYKATTSDDLQGTFNEIAKSIIASSKNVMLRTSRGYFDEEYPKYFRFKFEANGYKDSVDAKMVGTPQEGYEMQIIKEYNKYVTFNNPTYGNVDAETGKVHIPLNNLKFIVNGNELQFDFEVYVSNDNEYYYYDVEDASKSEAISKRIAVVLVLDCSTSMGNAFVPMKQAAIDFIETLENMDSSTDTSEKPNTEVHSGHEYVDLGLSVKWATMNVGATSPEGYGDYYAWGETETKSSYTLNNYKWYESSKGTYTKYTGTEPRSAVEKRSTGSGVYLRGNGDWVSLDREFTDNGDGTYTLLGPITLNSAFKIGDDSWGDINFGSYYEGAKIGTISVDYGGGDIAVNNTIYASRIILDINNLTLTIEGTGGGEIKITSWTIVGIEELMGDTWDPTSTANIMTESNGVFTLTKKGVYLTTSFVTEGYDGYGYKVVANGTWGVNEYPFMINQYLEVSMDGFYDVKFTWIPFPELLTAEATLVGVDSDGLYSVLVNGADLYPLTDEGAWDTDPSYNQFSLKGVALKAGDTFVFYNNETGDTWANTALDPATEVAINGTGEVFEVTEDGCYSVYLKTKFLKDNVYFGIGNCAKSSEYLSATDDAAKVSWGGNWRMPSKAEVEELVNSCTWQSSTQNGVKGYKVISKTNGNYIFLPAAGYRNNSNLNLSNSYGGYWTSSSSEEDSSNAYLLYFGNNNDINTSNTYRYYGQSIRPVLP